MLLMMLPNLNSFAHNQKAALSSGLPIASMDDALARTASPDERSDIRGDVSVVPDVATLSSGLLGTGFPELSAP